MEIPISAFSTWCSGSAKAATSRPQEGRHAYLRGAVGLSRSRIRATQIRAVVRHADQRQGDELEAQQHHEALKAEALKSRPCMDKVTPKSDMFQANRDRAAPLLAKLKEEGIGHMIDGKTVPSISGATLRDQIADRRRGARDCGARQCGGYRPRGDSRRAAFKSWRDMSPSLRKKLLHRVADAIEDRADDIAVLECIDTGQAHRSWRKPRSGRPRISVSSPTNAPTPATASTCQAMSTGISRRACRSARGRDHAMEHAVHAVDLEDCAGVGGWLHGGAQAGGMVAGHRRSARETGEAGGRPDGVLNTVHGIGEEAGKALTEHPAIKAIGFVGESATGSAIMAQGAPTLKRVHFELGGKNPVIVFDDADLDRALMRWCS